LIPQIVHVVKKIKYIHTWGSMLTDPLSNTAYFASPNLIFWVEPCMVNVVVVVVVCVCVCVCVYSIGSVADVMCMCVV